MNGNLENRVSECCKEIDKIKASQFLGESNYRVHEYSEEYETTYDSSITDIWFQFTFTAREEAFTIAEFNIELWVNGSKESFSFSNHNLTWNYSGSVVQGSSYGYTVSPDVNKGYFYGYLEEYNTSWAGRTVRLRVTVKASREGTLAVKDMNFQ